MSRDMEQRSPQQKICGYEYTVKRGDSFYLIAQRLGVPLRDLLEANSEVNPARLMVGDVLCIPMEEDDAVVQPAIEPEHQQSAPAQTPTEHQEQLAEQVTEMVLDAMPPMLDLTPTEAPDVELTAEMQAEVTIEAPASCGCDCASGLAYTVAAGETVADIQQSADLSLKTLEAANPGIDLNCLTGGETLCIPKTKAPCRSARFYPMAEGDNIESLAVQLDLSVGALLRANPCLAPSEFKPGMVISLP